MRLTEEQLLLRDTARQVAQDLLAPHAAAWDREARFPQEALAELGRLGFMGMLVPPEYGGAGADHVGYALALEEIAAGDGATSTIVSVNSLCCAVVQQYSSEEQKQRFLKPMAAGDMLAAFCLTEPQAGSDAAAIKTRARRQGNRWVLNGTKQFITSGSTAKVAIVFAVTDPDAGRKGISAFIVPTDTPGYKVARLEHKLGQRASDTTQLVFEDMQLTPDLMLGGRATGSPSPTSKAVASASPRNRSAWLVPPTRPRSPTPRSGRPSARRLSAIRRWRSASPTWRRRSPPRAGSCSMPRRAATPASRA